MVSSFIYIIYKYPGVVKPLPCSRLHFVLFSLHVFPLYNFSVLCFSRFMLFPLYAVSALYSHVFPFIFSLSEEIREDFMGGDSGKNKKHNKYWKYSLCVFAIKLFLCLIQKRTNHCQWHLLSFLFKVQSIFSIHLRFLFEYLNLIFQKYILRAFLVI